MEQPNPFFEFLKIILHQEKFPDSILYSRKFLLIFCSVFRNKNYKKNNLTGSN